ncbi:GGDEF domain-containing protein [Sabulicella rubraurantiaca]|uniref:GGDEF domain-containing protein n=1 Tax=Sabulicella rubraurantiaca TaxID=2811429 RepID=UPI001A96CC1F|nr:GGDEF domain-containing protein [Sabulicella rubraurantiaca]
MPSDAPSTTRTDPAMRHAHDAIAALLHHGLRPTPPNYVLWFEFHAGQAAALRAALEDRLRDPSPLGEAEMAALHARFGASPSGPTLAEISRRLGEAVRDAAVILDGTATDAVRYERSLEGAAAALASGTADWPEVLAGLIRETQALRDKGAILARRLAETGRRAEALREELEEARREAATDVLTGRPNRRAFETALERHLAGDALPCLLLLDVDHFKAVNDRHGHAAGDLAVRHLGTTLREAARAADMPARLGGEEFAVLMPGTPPERAMCAAEALRQAIAREGVMLEDGTRLALTVSGGLAAATPGEGSARLIERADAALYAAKRAGRNRIEAAP